MIKLVNCKRNRSRTCYKENEWLLEVMRSRFRELKTLRCRSVHLNQLPPHCRNFVSLEYMACSEQVSMTVLFFDRPSTPLFVALCLRPRVRCEHFQMALMPDLHYATTFISTMRLSMPSYVLTYLDLPPISHASVHTSQPCNVYNLLMP